MPTYTDFISYFNKSKHLAFKVSNHQFNWWFAISPPKGYVTARPKGRCHKHFYWSAIKRYFLNLLFSILLLVLLYTWSYVKI